MLIKAPWIGISRDAAEADNQLPGTVSAIEPGEQMSEVLMRLPAEKPCAPP